MKYYTDETANSDGDISLIESYPKVLSPTIGLEYFILDKFSFGGELRYNILSDENTSGDVTMKMNINYISYI